MTKKSKTAKNNSDNSSVSEEQSSDISEVDVKKLNEELDLLNIEKNSLLDDITKLLGK